MLEEQAAVCRSPVIHSLRLQVPLGLVQEVPFAA